jgi:hypothetical protein
MPKQILKPTTKDTSKVLREGSGSKKNLVTVTNNNINTPDQSRLSSPYCKVCKLTKCSCKKEYVII